MFYSFMSRLLGPLLFACQPIRPFAEASCSDHDTADLAAPSFVQMISGAMLRGNQSEERPEYFWPSARGHVGSYGTSEITSIRNISAGPSWSWEDSRGRWSNIPTSTCIDDKKNIYLTLATGAIKFSSSGQVLWEYKPALDKSRSPKEQISDGSSLWEGAFYGLTTGARIFALDMETGEERWSTTVGTSKSLNFGQAAAHDGVVIVATQSDPKGSAAKFPAISLLYGSFDDTITGLNATDGSVLWSYKPEDHPVWNFAASFVGDGTFVYQDLSGKAFRRFVNNGSLIWSAGGIEGSWTDGHASIGANGIVYTVANYGSGAGTPAGVLTAYRLSDGQWLWSQPTSRPPNAAPVVGQLVGKTKPSVVLPAGQQTIKGEQIVVYAYDAETGEPQWTFYGPRQQGDAVAGDAEGVKARMETGIRPMTAPNPWGQAVIDKAGTVFIGGETGHIFSLRDSDGNGQVNPDDPEEVSMFDTGAAFVGSSGPALADGMLAVAPQDRLHVWLW